MFANFLIGLREGLEAALVIGILVAYLVKIGRSDLLRQAWTGVTIAIGVSLAVGAALTFGPRELAVGAEEAITGSLSLVAVGLVTWMVFWLARASRTFRSRLEGSVDDALAMGASAVLLIALVAVGREGLETALFVWASVNASGTTAGPLAGALLGITVAVGLGVLVSKGAIHLNLGAFFRWTGVVLVVIAAGVLAYAVHELQEAHILPGEGAMAFDVSAQVPPDSWYGTLLRGTFNFRSRATVLELVAYIAYLVPTMALYLRLAARRSEPAAPSPAKEAPLSVRS